MNLVLIGYRGSGKTTVGKRLAARMGKEFVDTDDLLEKQHGALISDIVKFHGWDYFRAMEREIIEGISNQDHLVIAPGGGALLDPENILALKRNGFIIWLKADGHTIRKRMEKDCRTGDRRPSLTGKGIFDELEEVMAFRYPIYEKVSEAQIDTSALSPEEVVETIFSIFHERMGRI